MKHTAKFIPLSGYLLCPHCNEKITSESGKTSTIYDTKGSSWESMRKESWQCGKCRGHFSLPVNPFKATQEETTNA